MTATIKAIKARCPFCPAKGEKEKPVFSVKSDGLNSAICGEHLWSFLQAKDESAQEPPAKGKVPAGHEGG